MGTICLSQKVDYYTIKPVVLLGFPNKINFSNNLNFDSLIVFSESSDDVICIENEQLYWIPNYQKDRLFIAEEKDGKTIIYDTLEFTIVNLDLDNLDFITVNRQFHSGFTDIRDTNRIQYYTSKLYEQFNVNQYLKIKKISIRVIAKENGMLKLDTVLNFNSNLFYIRQLMDNFYVNTEIVMELISFEFTLQNMPCGISDRSWMYLLKKRKLFPVRL